MRARSRAGRYLAAAALAAGLAMTPAADAQPPIKRVLAIHGGPESFPGNATLDDAIQETLFSQTAIEVDYYAEYLENEEFGEVASTAMRDTIRVKFRDRPLDLVIANTAPVLGFVLEHRDELFANLPIVFAAASPPAALLRGELSGITGVVRNPSQTETVDLALRLHPGTTRVHVVAYAPVVKGFQERVQDSLAPFAQRVTITYEAAPTLTEALANIKALPANSLIFYARYSPLTTGRAVFPDELLTQVVEAARVPIYSSLDTNLGKGVVGGMMRSGAATGRRLGEMTLKIFSGATPDSIPVEAPLLTPIFDWRQVRRWGIDSSSLPPGSDIRFRVPTVWELYGSYIIATSVVVIAQLLLIAGLLRQRARLRNAENTIRARELSLRTSYQRIREMAGRLINVQETARADIARDLHDDVSQKLAYASIGLTTLRSATGNIQDPPAQQAFEELDRDMRSTFEGIRKLSHDLHPATLRLAGLVPALRSHCAEVAKRQGVEVQFSSSNVGSVAPDVALCFFRIAQESLRNGIMHGGAKRLTVTLARSNNRLELSVTDDGRGFDVSAVQSKGGGLGLVTMEERVNLVGGEVSIVSAPGRGTTVRVFAPTDQALADETGDSQEKAATR